MAVNSQKNPSESFLQTLNLLFEYRQTENRMCHKTKYYEIQNHCSKKDLVSMNYHWQKYSERQKICHR